MKTIRLLLMTLWLFTSAVHAGDAPRWRIATFAADVTPPLGHPLIGGITQPAKQIDDPLFVHGFVLLGEGKPIVVASIDWCEIRNDAYDRWREALAAAARTDREHVLFSSIHQHDAPLADLTAQRILEKAKAKGRVCDLELHEKFVQRAAQALKASLKNPRPVTHLGTGQAKVDKVASNRRYLDAGGKPQFGRSSGTRDAFARGQPEGTVDPWLKTLSFWNGEQALAALHVYAVHPMTWWGKGEVSADFPGLARKRRQSDDPKVLQIYASGCSGNLTAGKYNDGDKNNRAILAERIYQAMKAAWKDTSKQPFGKMAFRNVKLELPPRDSPGFTVKDLEKRLAEDPEAKGQSLAALGLSWRQRVARNQAIDVPALDWSHAALVLLPAESYVEYQLMAQALRPKDFVMVMGYGECGPGYIPTEKAVEEKDGNLGVWNWVAPGAEPRMRAALKKVLKSRTNATSARHVFHRRFQHFIALLDDPLECALDRDGQRHAAASAAKAAYQRALELLSPTSPLRKTVEKHLQKG